MTSRLDLDRFLDADPPPDVPAGPAFGAWRVRVLSFEELRALEAPALLAYLAWFGLLAPTSHNTVPQRFELSADEMAIRVWLDRERVLRESDPTGRQAAVSVGCAIANVVSAARAAGFEASVEVAPTALERTRPAAPGEERLVKLATMRLARTDAPLAPAALLERMRQRKMVRAEYDETVKLPVETATALRGLVEATGGLRLYLLSDAATLLFLGKFQELADSTVINRQGFARELGDWLLANDEDAAPLGMRGREFGLDDEAAHRFHQGLRGELRLLPDETVAFAKAGNVGMRSASAVAVITVERDDLGHRLAAGQAFQHAALRLLEEGFVVAMHAGITEVDAPNLALRGRLRTTWRPEVVFRVGKPLRAEDGARPHAARPHLADVLLAPGGG